MAQKKVFTKPETEQYFKLFQDHQQFNPAMNKGYVSNKQLLNILNRCGIAESKLRVIFEHASNSDQFSRTQFAHVLQMCAFE